MKPIRGGSLVAIFGVCVVGGFATSYALQSGPGRSPPPELPADDPLRGLDAWLSLRPEQVVQLSRVDPEFARQREKLESELAAERETLAEMFEDPTTADETILEQVETVIAAHNALERRVSAYLLALRPHLTDAQRTKLFSQCAESVREAGGWRWRRGAPQGNDEGGQRRGRGPGRGGGRGKGPP